MSRKALVCLLWVLFLLLSACGGNGSASNASVPESRTEAASVQDTEDTDTGLFLSVSEEYALGMLKKSLPKNTPYTIETLDFTAPNITTVSGTVDLRALAEQYDVLSFVSSILPTDISFTSSCAFTFSEKAGFTITPTGLEVTDFTVPADILPASLYNYYADALNDYIRSLPIRVTEVTMTDEAINITG